MLRYSDILKLKEEGFSLRSIASSTGNSRQKVTEMTERAVDVKFYLTSTSNPEMGRYENHFSSRRNPVRRKTTLYDDEKGVTLGEHSQRVVQKATELWSFTSRGVPPWTNSRVPEHPKSDDAERKTGVATF